MPQRRSALLIATDAYEDASLRRLRSPASDARALSEVLVDPDIGDFEVGPVLLNEPTYRLMEEVGEFFADRRKDDLLLLYLSCHGVLDHRRRLYFATVNTRRDRLPGTALPASFVNERVSDCLSRSILVLLDCCHSGAFARGMVAKADADVGLEEKVAGRGRVVITASSELEYAFEGDELVDAGRHHSIFTRAVVEGLRSGEADVSDDDRVSADDLYDYVDERVRNETDAQTPSIWAFEKQGEMLVAHSRHRRPSIAADLAAEPPEVTVGERVSWRLSVANESAQQLHNVVAIDAEGGVVAGPLTLEPRERRAVEWSMIADAGGRYVLTMTGTDGRGRKLREEVFSELTVHEPAIALAAGLEAVPPAVRRGDSVTWRLTLHNTGAVPLRAVTATRDDGERLSDPFELEPSERRVLSWSGAPPVGGEATVTASAVDDIDRRVVVHAGARVAVRRGPAVQLRRPRTLRERLGAAVCALVVVAAVLAATVGIPGMGTDESIVNITTGEGLVWATSARAGTVTRLDPATGRTLGRPIEVGDGPDGVAVAAGMAWVTNFGDDTVSRLNADTGEPVGKPIAVPDFPHDAVAAKGALWVLTSDTVTRIDLESARVVGQIAVKAATESGVAARGGSVWATAGLGNEILRIDADSGRVSMRASTELTPEAISVGPSGVWITHQLNNRVSHLDASSGHVLRTIEVSEGPRDIVVAGDVIWVACSFSDDVVRLDARTGERIGRPIRLEGSPYSLAVGEGSVWVTNYDNTLTRISRTSGQIVGAPVPFGTQA